MLRNIHEITSTVYFFSKIEKFIIRVLNAPFVSCTFLRKLIGRNTLIIFQGIICLTLALMYSGCHAEKEWQLHEITGHLPNLSFSLLSDANQPVTEQTYQGYPVMLFFGYTKCQSECPATLFRLQKVLERLKVGAKSIRILFVTLDPNYDTPYILHRYVTAFDNSLVIGLTGNKTDIESITKRYRIAYNPRSSDADQIVHGAAVYVFDQQGHARLLITPSDGIDAIVADMRHLLKASQ